MKAVFDTNVLVSALISPTGPPGKLLDLVLEGRITLCVDERIMAEYTEVLWRPELKFNHETVNGLLGYIRESSTMVMAPVMKMDLPDPDDRMFVEVAASAQVSLVTGNLRHFPAEKISGIGICSPAQFLERIEA